MTTSYCDTNYWAKQKQYATFVAYQAAGYEEPNETGLQADLDAATEIMNDTEHLNTSTNITTSRYVERLKQICYNIAERKRSVERNKGFQGAMFTFSPQDYLYVQERNFLLNVSRIQSKRRIGGVVF